MTNLFLSRREEFRSRLGVAVGRFVVLAKRGPDRSCCWLGRRSQPLQLQLSTTAKTTHVLGSNLDWSEHSRPVCR